MHAHPADFCTIADHLALDLLNTLNEFEGRAHDDWRSGEDVQAWFAHLGIAVQWPQPCDLQALRAEAVQLREQVRALATQRKAGLPADPSGLNQALRHAARFPQVQWASDGQVSLRPVGLQASIGRALAPLAEAAAQLLVEADWRRVRQCAHPDCILWFLDTSKSGRRRWCSMALCGNRAKVAAHRARQG